MDAETKTETPVATPSEAIEKVPEEEKRKREENDEGEENLHPMWKTSLCSFYRRQPGKPGCSHGDKCRYAHSEAELRPRPDNTWDPTSERAVKKLKQQQLDEQDGASDDEVVDFTILEKCIVGISRNWNTDSLNNFLRGEGVEYKTANKKKGMTVGFVNFESSDQVKSAIEAFKEKSKSSGKKIKIVDAVPKRKKIIFGGRITDLDTSASVDHDDNDGLDNELSVVEGVSAKTKSARDCVTPLADIPYTEQLEQKKSSIIQTLKKLTRNARKACPPGVSLPEWIVKSKEIGGLPCSFEGILESPVIDGYRNKCEFSVGYSVQGKPIVGFTLGNFRDGVTAIEEPINCPNVSKIAYEYVVIFQEFLQSSHLPVWNRIENKGFWRQFTVREGRNPNQHALVDKDENHIMEVMLIIQVCSVDIDDEIMKGEFERMVKVLEHGATARSSPLPLTTVVVQDHKGISNVAPADCPLIPLLVPKIEASSEKKDDNEARIHDYISNLRFSISPTAFFQVNTLAAERLYSLAGDWARLTRDTLLFDVCCGTGTIGLTLAHRVGMVVGIEMNESAVSDAQRNAEINGITNCRFVCGKAENVIGSLLKEYLNAPQQDNIASNGSGQSEHNDISNDHVTDPLLQGKMGTDAETTCNPLSNDSCTKEIQSCSEGLSIDSEVPKLSDEEVKEKGKHVESHETTEEKNLCSPSINHSVPTNGCSGVGQDSAKNNLELKELTDISNDENVGNSPKQFADVVVIVDPPRGGLHPVVLKALRTHPCLRRLVYISCNPDTLVANAIELCTPTTDKQAQNKGNMGWRNMSSAGLARHRIKSMPNSEPFQPVMAKAVDLFPHTTHCEMVMLFER